MGEILSPHGITIRRLRTARVTVEDAFVSMVRQQERSERPRSA
jgi:hypothetical protein